MILLRFLGRFVVGLTGWADLAPTRSARSVADKRGLDAAHHRDEAHDMTMWFMADEDDW